ncbi:MAG: thermonuclease family protein [Planctomycetota bacterium]
MIDDPRRWAALAMLLAPALLFARVASQAPVPRTAAAASRAAGAESVEIERVVDGDTIHVRRAGKIEKLRLVSVDTEERLGEGHSSSPTKPQTVFGEECAIWAERLFAGLGTAGGKARVGLVFPGGVEERDAYGRLLCRVLLPDGTDYNLMLVQLGRSPYFNKYGNDLEDHAAYVAAQDAARRARRGIWNPATNEAKTPGAPSAKRPYSRLLPWWDARAAAVDAYRERAAKEPGAVADAEDAASLARAARSGREVDVFGEIDRLFDESDGSRTVLFRASNKDKSLRVRIPLSARRAHESFGWESVTRDFRQNYVWVRGRVEIGQRGFEMRSSAVDRWRLAGPEPD